MLRTRPVAPLRPRTRRILGNHAMTACHKRIRDATNLSRQPADARTTAGLAVPLTRPLPLRPYRCDMSVSTVKLPLSAVYLNLLQSRPVGAASAAGRAVPPNAADPVLADTTDRGAPRGGSGRALGRGRLVDILA